MRPVEHVVVPIPAHDEEALIGRCLSSVDLAVTAARRARPGLTVTVVVAVDGCTDRTAERATTTVAGALVELVHLDGVGVGSARDAAIAHALRGAVPLRRTWLACTDADSVVPPAWLHRQLVWADQGLDLVIGTVEPDGVPDPVVLAAWHARHQLTEGHGYVHGANLGLRASAWRDCGGFGTARLHEDAALVSRVQQGSRRWVATDTTRVRTSGRLDNRVEGGFGGFLAELGTDAG